MGGGALMTPMLVLFFDVPPLAAVSSDLVASAVMKPVGGLVHLRRGTVNLRLVGWLCVGSVPAAFCGVLVARALGGRRGGPGRRSVRASASRCSSRRRRACVRSSAVARATRAGSAAAGRPGGSSVRPIPTVLVGAVGGLVVGMTSVGSGSLIIVALLLLYPTLKASQLVGTDLVQAVPLVASAAARSHPVRRLPAGPHAVAAARRASPASTSAPGFRPGRPAAWSGALLAFVLLASALKLLGVADLVTLARGGGGRAGHGHRPAAAGQGRGTRVAAKVPISRELGECPRPPGVGVEAGVASRRAAASRSRRAP